MLDRNISFNSVVLSYLKDNDSLSEDRVSGDTAPRGNAFGSAVNRIYQGKNVRSLLLTEAKIGGIADIEIGLIVFRNREQYPSLFFEKVDIAMLSVVSIGIINVCEEGKFFCIENDETNVISSELSIIPRFRYPIKSSNQKDFPVSFFRGTFRYRHRISTGISLRRFLYCMYDNSSRELSNSFRKIEPVRSFSSFISINLLKNFINEKWCDRLQNILNHICPK